MSQPANISRKWFCIQNVSMKVMFQIATDPVHVEFILLEILEKYF